MSLQLGGGGEGVTAPMRAVRSTSTMAFAYELRRMSRQPEEPQHRLERELIMMDPTHLFQALEGGGGEQVLAGAAKTQNEDGEEEETVFVSKRKTINLNRLTVALGANSPITSELTTSALLQTPPNAIPNAESGIELKLCEPGERLEIIVDPVPNNTASEEGGNRSMFNFLGGDGVKQPTILFGSVGYVIDYLVAPHAGANSTGNAKPNLAKFASKPQQQQSSVNLLSKASPSNNNNVYTDELAALARSVVKDTLPFWVKSLWDSFLLTFKEGITVLDFVRELLLRFGKSGQDSTVAVQQSAFETKDGHLVVASRKATENAAMNRSARAVLMWMGIYQNHRNALGIRTNTLLLTLHWLKTGSGALDLVENREAFDLLQHAMRQPKPGEDSSVLVLMRILSRELDLIQTTCQFALPLVQKCFGLDFGASGQQQEDLDQYRMRELLLCIHPYSNTEHPLPKWARQMPIFNQNPELVASIITLLTYDLAYRHVHPLMMATDAKRQNSQPVKDMIRMFKVYSYWPLTCILEDDLKLGEVFDRLLFFLAVAEQLRRLSNFHALFAIVGGLTQPFMSWVWTALPPTHKAHKRFGDLKRLISSNGDYRVYKADLSHCQGKSRIPFLGVSLRMLVQLEMEPAQPEAHHPQLYHFSRQVARSAAINDFVGGQRHPYQCLNGTAFSIVSGPPGPSPYMLVDGGTVSGSKHAQFPPSSATQGVYSPSLLGTGLEPVSLRVSSTAIQVEDKRAYSGMVELLDELDLKLALCYSISITQEESALREISTDVQRALLAV